MKTPPELELIHPDWPAPPAIQACCTTRNGGVSAGTYASFNLAAHVDDDPDQVAQNRRQLVTSLELPAEPQWLEQIHSTTVMDLDRTQTRQGDAGWRGLVGGVVEQSVSAMRSEPAQLMAWLGPAIGPHNFEVGSEVREAFVRQHASAEACFQVNRPGHYLADLYALARLRLELLGIRQISGGEYCTYQDQQRFFSYRRDRHTGRQASLIYIRP